MHAKRFAIAMALCALVGGGAALAFPGDIDLDVVRVYEQDLVLPSDGSDVTLFIWAYGGDILVHEIFVSNAPTLANGLCEYLGGTGPGDPVECSCSSYRLKRTTVDFSDYRPGEKPEYIASEDRIATRPILDQHDSLDTAIPIQQGSLLALTFDTECDDNPVALKATIGIFGARAIVYAETETVDEEATAF